jgi:hypothetical protein
MSITRRSRCPIAPQVRALRRRLAEADEDGPRRGGDGSFLGLAVAPRAREHAVDRVLARAMDGGHGLDARGRAPRVPRAVLGPLHGRDGVVALLERGRRVEDVVGVLRLVPVWKSTAGSGRPDQTLKFSITRTLKSG